jgi:hypothetical protein
VTPHSLYTSLGTNDDARRSAYRDLFATDTPPLEVPEIRTAPPARHTLGMMSHHQAVVAMYEGDARDLSVHDGQSHAAE